MTMTEKADDALDVEAIRAETPGTAEVNHLIACGSSLMPKQVIDALVDHIRLEGRIGGYEAHAARSDELDGVYDSVARLIGAEPTEIALCENATVAWCHAFYALPLKAGDRVLTCHAEYAANYVAYLQRAKRDGIIIDVIPNDGSGQLDVDALEKMIDDDVALIAITWVPTNGGLVNPAHEVGRIAKRHGVPYLLDACQTVGQMPIDVGLLGCDFLSATSRKFLRGPRGIGFLYMRSDWISKLEPVIIDHFAAPWVDRDTYELRADARRFESWENAYALRAGLGVAADYALNMGLENIQKRSWALADSLRQRLRDVPGATIFDAGERQCAITSFTIEGLDAKETVARLRNENIMIGASEPASTRIDAETRRLPIVLRAAPHYYNTEEELDALVSALRSAIR
jgi:cysteine desulfurase / selenocysteine lyase